MRADSRRFPPRVTARRPWIKLYSIDCLEGSIRYQLEPDERSVWYELLLLASLCVIPGQICDKDQRAYPHSFIANRLNISLELLERTLTKCFEEGRLEENDRGIVITNWHAYQSEYQRQKPYRQAAKQTAEDMATRERYSNMVRRRLDDDNRDSGAELAESGESDGAV